MNANQTARPIADRPARLAPRDLLSPLNLHIAGVALLLLVNLYLLAQLVFLWQKSSSNGPGAVAEQRIALKAAEVRAQPLRGLDQKLETATEEADRFYDTRLPRTDSEVLTELGTLTREHNVRLTRGQYLHAPVLAGTPAELTEMRIDTSLSGNYRPLVQVINALERDRMFFLIEAVSLSGEQNGTVNLRLRLRTFLRGHVEDQPGVVTESPQDQTANAGGPQP